MNESTWNPAKISRDIMKIAGGNYTIIDKWTPSELNGVLRMFKMPVVDTWNPAELDEARRRIVEYIDSSKTFSGNPVTFNVYGNLTPGVTEALVLFTPIQDLHGYEHPWVGGSGKNKYDGENQSFTYNKDYTITLTAGTYTVSAITTTNATTNPCIIFFNGTSDIGRVYLASGSRASDTVTIEQDTTKIRFQAGSTTSTSTDKSATFTDVQIELGSTATPYEPYENICPITGYTELNIYQSSGSTTTPDETYTATLGATYYGGSYDFVTGDLISTYGYISEYDGETLPGVWISDRDVYASGTTPTTGAEVAYILSEPVTDQLTEATIELNKGINVFWTDADTLTLSFSFNN